ncbi:hypothetical protein GC088_02730 [Arthrobacter sp. JZ12]|uniref:hypothetical protein n=1 Tax=Arthrobacter sp. JZ12 TaxID=2654190 RepID=UPI002B49D279|nr:hypothetical protein [Arthrobacter sp. JZ12]WRH24117.1 hypothetical protein GC088_02730 [Arthrobacter sp. JZ12]
MGLRSTALAGSAVLMVLTACGCAPVEENPLDVNSPRIQQGSLQQSSSDTQAQPDIGEDPLNLADNGATLCYTQPDIGFQEFTVLLHNEALETFTLDDVTLEDSAGLTLKSAEVSPANREGHHKAHDDDGGAGHEAHGSSAAPVTAEVPAKAGPTEPVPAAGYAIGTHDYVNLVVRVSIADDADAGTAQGVTVAYSTGGREFTGTHPLVIKLEREGCA